jgi:hypothetical protein
MITVVMHPHSPGAASTQRPSSSSRTPHPESKKDGATTQGVGTGTPWSRQHDALGLDLVSRRASIAAQMAAAGHDRNPTY